MRSVLYTQNERCKELYSRLTAITVGGNSCCVLYQWCRFFFFFPVPWRMQHAWFDWQLLALTWRTASFSGADLIKVSRTECSQWRPWSGQIFIIDFLVCYSTAWLHAQVTEWEMMMVMVMMMGKLFYDAAADVSPGGSLAMDLWRILKTKYCSLSVQ